MRVFVQTLSAVKFIHFRLFFTFGYTWSESEALCCLRQEEYYKLDVCASVCGIGAPK